MAKHRNNHKNEQKKPASNKRIGNKQERARGKHLKALLSKISNKPIVLSSIEDIFYDKAL
jgi:hypothetical protein